MRVVWLCTLLLAAAGGFYFFGGKSGHNPGDKKGGGPVAVTVDQVARQPFYDEYEALGTARANESVDITTNVSERVVGIHFTEGQQVEANAPLVSLAHAEEAAELSAEQAQLAEHERELKRLENLIKTQATAEKILDERKTLLEKSKANIRAIEARIFDRTLMAPFAGVLGLRRVSQGDLIEPGTVITTLDDVDPIKLDFTVPSAYLNVVSRGAKIEASASAYPDEIFHGTIETVDSRVDPDTRSILVRAVLPNSNGKLKPGLLLTVKLIKNQRNTLLLPEDAVIDKADKHFVYRVNGERKVEQVEVTLGTRKPGIVEALGGVQEGDKVIVRGITRVRPGQEVEVREGDPTYRPLVQGELSFWFPQRFRYSVSPPPSGGRVREGVSSEGGSQKDKGRISVLCPWNTPSPCPSPLKGEGTMAAAFLCPDRTGGCRKAPALEETPA